MSEVITEDLISSIIFGIVFPTIVKLIMFIIKSKYPEKTIQAERPSNRNAVREMIKDELELYSEFLEMIQTKVHPKINSILQFAKFPESERLLSPGNRTMTITHYNLSTQEKAEFFSSLELKEIENAYESVRNYGFRWNGMWETLKGDSLKLKSKIDKALEHFD